MSEHSSYGVNIAGECVPYHEIHNVFADSEHGSRLASMTRWDRYRPEYVTRENWQSLLGLDANNLHHMGLTEHIVGGFLRVCQAQEYDRSLNPQAVFSEEERESLRLAAVIHDWGESIVGDTNYLLKTSRDEEEEYEALAQIIGSQANLHGVDQSLLAHKMNFVRAEVIGNRDSKLGRAFNAVERMGYIGTAVRAWRMHYKMDDPSTRYSLQVLAAGTLSAQTPAMLEYSQVYPPVDLYLKGRSRDIADAFSGVDDGVFDFFNEGERDRLRVGFANARDLYSRTFLVAA